MMKQEFCIRCGQPTSYYINTPIVLRRYFIEGSGQLCEKCFYELYPQSSAFDYYGYVRSAGQDQNQNKKE